MEKVRKRPRGPILMGVVAALFVLCVGIPAQAASSGSQEMQRLYNPNSGEHFYTASTTERDHLVSVGWNYEGVGWVAPAHSDTPVYRLYNANGGEHHYTTNAGERSYLVSVGWNDEGIGWYSDDSQRVPLYRQYNPNAFSCNHNYTTSKSENDWLVSLGWRAEGTGWYGIGAGWSVAPSNDSGNQSSGGSGGSGSSSSGGGQYSEYTGTVYWTPGGKSYHYSSGCRSLRRSRVIRSGSLQQARAAGKTDPCNNCVR